MICSSSLGFGVAKDEDWWTDFVNTLLSFWFHKMLGSSYVAAQLVAPYKGLGSLKLVSVIKKN